MQGYRRQLDSLRALAVSAVLLTHFWLYESQLSSLGVRLFFVLSGFLLTSILLRERDEAARHGLPRRKVLIDFYARRILRIWPAYYFVLVAAVIAGSAAVASTFGWHAAFASNILFFLDQRWYPPVTSHLWTLSVEEQPGGDAGDEQRSQPLDPNTNLKGKRGLGRIVTNGRERFVEKRD